MAANSNPRHALHREAGVGLENSASANIQSNQYANPTKFQAQRLRQRFGLSDTRAALLATLHYGEVQL